MAERRHDDRNVVPRRSTRNVHAVQVQVGRVGLPRLIPIARVVAVFQVIDERELDLVAGLQDEARAAERSIVHARFERRVRRLERDHVDGQRRREETVRRLDLVVRQRP